MRDLPLGEISEVFNEWAKEMNIPTRDIMFSMDRDKPNLIHIYTDRPGLMIGRAGSLVDKYKSKLNHLVDNWNVVIKRCNDKNKTNEPPMPYVEINFVEVVRANFWLNYESMGDCL